MQEKKLFQNWTTKKKQLKSDASWKRPKSNPRNFFVFI